MILYFNFNFAPVFSVIEELAEIRELALETCPGRTLGHIMVFSQLLGSPNFLNFWSGVGTKYHLKTMRWFGLPEF